MKAVKALSRAADLLAEQARSCGAPSYVTFQVTDRCNYSCSHCYQEHEGNSELSTEEVFDILGQLAEAGVLFLTFMGGEFFMRRDADEILQKAHDLGFALKVLSTGHHIHEKRADFLATIRPLQVDISIYGSKPAIHEHVTRQEGSWQRSLDAIGRLVARKIPVVLKTPVMQSNVDDLKGIAVMADSLGAKFTFDPKITAIEDGDLQTTRFRMNEGSVADLYRETMPDFIDQGYGRAHTEDLRPLGDSPCRAGKDVCGINPQGEVWPCSSMPYPVGDLRKQSFASIWSSSPSLEEVRGLTWATISECNECPVRSYCSRCHAMALVEDGKLRGPSLEACRHAVAVRDSLRSRGKIPATETQLPPTWNRVSADGQHDRLPSGGRRVAALKVL